VLQQSWGWLAVIDVARGEAVAEQRAFVIDDQMELEAVEPAQTAFARGSNLPIVTDGKRGRIYEANLCIGLGVCASRHPTAATPPITTRQSSYSSPCRGKAQRRCSCTYAV